MVVEETWELNWQHTKGHTGIAGNERADRNADRGAAGLTRMWIWGTRRDEAEEQVLGGIRTLGEESDAKKIWTEQEHPKHDQLEKEKKKWENWTPEAKQTFWERKLAGGAPHRGSHYKWPRRRGGRGKGRGRGKGGGEGKGQVPRQEDEGHWGQDPQRNE